MATEPEEYLAVLKASYAYTPQSEDEIAMEESQLLFLLQRVDEDWWKVKVKGDSQEGETAVGLVPAAYVEPADHTSVVKALYDYEAHAPGELSVKEDELLLVFDTEEEWLLVQSQTDGGKAGFVPGNYVEATSESSPLQSPIVAPSSPPHPASNYQDPAERVASTSNKVKADSIQTWSVSEVDKKGKKKKGTLGIGNGAVFFASESDKTPVQKWQTIDIDRVSIEKSKHVHITIHGSTPSNLHFQAGSKDNADSILEKLQSSKALSSSALSPSSQKDYVNGSVRLPPIRTDAADHEKARKSGASVHFSESSPVIIPAREASEGEEEEGDEGDEGPPQVGQENDDGEAVAGETATALYDFDADGEDELSVKEGERLFVIERDSDEWWKCQNTDGAEGVVPASYIELTATDSSADLAVTAAEARAAELAENSRRQVELDRLAAEKADKARATKDKEKAAKDLADRARAERERKKGETPPRIQATVDRRVDDNIPSKSSGNSRSSDNKPTSEPPKASPRPVEGNRPPPDQTRIWHDRSGQFRVEAAFLGFHGDKLRLHKINGVVVEVPSEKMSVEDIRYVEKLTSRKNSSTKTGPTPSDDDEPLAARRKSLQTDSSRETSARSSRSAKAAQIDWFEFFLSAGCDVDDCTRYATSFERDKIDESVLLDITESTMRSLGLREGDIIRVTKVIEKRKAVEKKNSVARQEQILRDEEYARQLQAEIGGGNSTQKQHSTSPAPNLFASPGGALKNNAARRGRPQPSKSLPPSTVDLNAITSASNQIHRTGSPVASAVTVAPSSPTSAVQPSRSATVSSGFGDDAWTNRPSSTRPLAPTPPTSAARTSSAPPAPAPSAPVSTDQSTGKSLAKTTEADIFDQLSRLSQLSTNKQSISPASTSVPATMTSPPASFQPGLGSIPLPQHLQNQQIGFIQPPQQSNGPRGPFAPVPTNQNLLQPLIPTNTGFNAFVPTRPTNMAGNQPPLPSFLGNPVPTFQPSQPLAPTPLGAPFGAFGPGSSIPANTLVQAHPTGFSPALGPQSFDNRMVSPPSIPPSISDATSPANVFAQMKSGALLPATVNSPSNNVSPANVFAQMKSGTFASGTDFSTLR